MPEWRCAEPAPQAPLGATLLPGDGGTSFAVWAPHAGRVQVCLFDADGRHEHARADLNGPAHPAWQGVWHGRLPQVRAGQVYGLRVHGPWAPHEGHRFNAAKVLLDPYAREVVGTYRAQAGTTGHDPAAPDRPCPIDDAAEALKARVVPAWTPMARRASRLPDDEVVLYELHVKGATMRHPDVPVALRGSYAGVAHRAFVDHLRSLGVTTVSLMPVHARADEARLQHLGLSNYWGYSPIAFMAAEPRYWSGRAGTTPMSEFREMVQALHEAGLEVVLDVVFNHTAETDEAGPTLSFRGLDNAAYYHLRKGHPALYENWTGCGNALKLSEPRVVQLVIDALRHWVEAGGVDGFRFDLAPVLARGTHGFSTESGFFAALQSDRVLRSVRLIAEPWDIGSGGYQLGRFPAGWAEWNDRYRDTVRAFWLTGGSTRGEFAHALAGSSRAFRTPGRNALASVNFVTAHDGFTLRDLVSHEHRHNGANGEHNRDGHHHNLSCNCGVEGATDDAGINHRRAQLQRALLTTLLVSQGTPMLLAGDEIGHSQGGNNNAYCQDNDTTWLQWPQADDGLLAYVRRVLALRRAWPVLRQATWHSGRVDEAGAEAASHPDLSWFAPHGEVMQPRDWEQAGAAPLVAHFGAGLLLLFNPTPQPQAFVLPSQPWLGLLRSDRPQDWGAPCALPVAPEGVTVPERSVWVLARATTAPEAASPPIEFPRRPS